MTSIDERVAVPRLWIQMSVSKQRREQSRKSGQALAFLFWLFIAAIAGSGTWYWTQVYVPNRTQTVYVHETVELAKTVSAGVRELTEWSTEETFIYYEKAVRELEEREGVQSSLIAELKEKVESLKAIRQERMERYEALLAEAKTFPVDSSRDVVLAFDERILKAQSEFEKGLGNELKRVWTSRRAEIVDKLQSPGSSGEVTVRTDPSDAEIYMDGKLLGNSPLRVGGVRAGTHEILVKKEAYREKLVSIEVEELEKLELSIQELEAITGRLEIRVTGGRAKDKIEVEIEERSDGSTVEGLELVQGYQYFEGREHTLKSLKIGPYVGVVIRNGVEAIREEFVVEEGKTTQVHLDL